MKDIPLAGNRSPVRQLATKHYGDVQNIGVTMCQSAGAIADNGVQSDQALNTILVSELGPNLLPDCILCSITTQAQNRENSTTEQKEQ
jgi:hypothetical protein